MDKRHFWGLRGRETLNRLIPGRLAAPWSKTGPNWAKTLPREAGSSICGVEIGEANGNSDNVLSRTADVFQTILSELKETFHEKSMLAQLGS